MTIRVLYICGIGPFGGASRSLYEAVKAMPKESVEAYFIGVHGSALPFYKEVATDMFATTGLTGFDNSRYSYYRGIRWLVLLREGRAAGVAVVIPALNLNPAALHSSSRA